MNFHNHPNNITMIDVIAWSTTYDRRPLFHLAGCTGEEGIMIERAKQVLATSELTLVRDLLSLLSRTDGVRELVLGNLATMPALLRWVTGDDSVS